MPARPDPLRTLYPDHRDRAVLISGGASGIGAAFVTAFAHQGARVGFVDLDRVGGAALAATLKDEGCKVAFEPCDVTDIAAYRDAISQLESRNGPTMTLINNAANDTRHDWSKTSPLEWDASIAVNLRHAYFAIQAVAPGMIDAGGGTIVNLGSISWMVMSAGIPVYEASKAAMHGLTRGMARELGGHSIRVNTLAPGWIMTKRQVTLHVTPESEAYLDKVQVLPGRCQPEDVAAMALFLTSDAARMVSAQTFIVDGGWVHG
jgi:D-xylose 1-dehydrogenase